MTILHKGISRKDNNTGINKTTPVSVLDINGGLKLAWSALEVEGMIRWKPTEKRPEYFNGTVWKEM